MREYGLDNGQMLCRVFMNLSLIQNNFMISYKKFQNLSAEIGGLLSLMMSVIIVFLNPFLDIEFHSKFMNDVFEVKHHHNIDAQTFYDKAI